jgi:CheY-like chemotaxis protein
MAALAKSCQPDLSAGTDRKDPMSDLTPAPRILVVDDDALIAMNTMDMVQELGYLGIEAYSAKQALEILADGTRIDAVITDYAMPGMTGLEFALKARDLYPGLPVLLASGYSDLPNGATTDLPRLNKPFELTELGEQLGRVLGQRAI